MKIFRAYQSFAVVAIIAVTAGCAAPRTQAAPPTASQKASQVSVHYEKPHQFAESQQAAFGVNFDHGRHMEKLRAFLIDKAAPMLKPSQHLSITFTDINLAGGFEPWRGSGLANVRIMKNSYPPTSHFRFTLTGPDGNVIRHGTRTLTNLTYLMDQSARPGNSDPLRYDKGLLERWLRKGPAHW